MKLVLDELIRGVDAHYETPELYSEPELSALEDRLFDALKVMAKELARHLTLIENAENTSPANWKEQLGRQKVSPFINIFDNTKWARQMKGRLYFYAHAPSHFDSQRVIEIELNRIGHMFFVVPYQAYWELKSGKKDKDLIYWELRK